MQKKIEVYIEKIFMILKVLKISQKTKGKT